MVIILTVLFIIVIFNTLLLANIIRELSRIRMKMNDELTSKVLKLHDELLDICENSINNNRDLIDINTNLNEQNRKLHQNFKSLGN